VPTPETILNISHDPNFFFFEIQDPTQNLNPTHEALLAPVHHLKNNKNTITSPINPKAQKTKKIKRQTQAIQ
jgi:hypothetical protein